MRKSICRKRAYPPAVLEFLGENDYVADYETYTAFVEESAVEKLRRHFGSEAMPVKGGLLGGGWLWLKFPG